MGGSIVQTLFGKLSDGTAISLFTLKNTAGMEARITNFGGILVSLLAPDRQGDPGDIILGYDTFTEYIHDSNYFGSIVGRYANRIARGTFTLEGIPYSLKQNDNGNHLHGGANGFNKAVWKARSVPSDEAPALELTYLSPDGEEGYPGNLRVNVVYTLQAGNELSIAYRAETDRTTVVNLTQHAYFNLAGAGDIRHHELCLEADYFLPVDAGLIPTGEIYPVRGTPMDFSRAARIGTGLDMCYGQVEIAGGYDHTWVIRGPSGTLRRAARLFDPGSCRSLEVFTTAPGLQFYSGNFLDQTPGRHGAVYGKHGGLCLETQHFPDSPNHPEFPSTILHPGQTYDQRTIYRCGVDIDDEHSRP